MRIETMKKITLLFVSFLITIGVYSQELDLSQISLRAYDRSKPYLGKEVVDTIGTCRAVMAALDSISEQGSSALESSGRSNFIRNYGKEIDAEVDRLANEYTTTYSEKAIAALEAEYQSLLTAVQDMAEDSESLNYYYKRGNLEGLKRYISDFIYNRSKKLIYNISGSLNWKKMSKALQKNLMKNETTVKEWLKVYLEMKARNTKLEELRPQAETNVLRNYVRKVKEGIPPVDSPNCYLYIHGWGAPTENTEYRIRTFSQEYFRHCDIFKKDKLKIVTWKNPRYYKEDNTWKWLSEEKDENGNAINREKIEKHYPIEETYFIDPRHPEYKIKHTNIASQYGVWEEVYAAFSGDSLKGVSNGFAYKEGDVDREMEQVLCFYELEHNKYGINQKPTYVKDCIRYDLVSFRYSNECYNHNLSFHYKKSHKPETHNLSEQYIIQLHLDHKNLGDDPSYFYQKINGFGYRRTERIDGTTFRHFIGKDEQIVILQKFVYGNYCWKLYPFSKVTLFDPKDYVINKDVYKPEHKVLTCYYIVEKYE